MATATKNVGAIDCDIHPSLPSLKSLLPYLEEHWRDSVITRGIHELDSIAYPLNSPLSARPDWRPATGKPASTPELVREQALDPFGTRYAICNCLYGIQVLFSEDMAAAFSSALNEWMAREFLDREPRLRASIVVPVQNPEMAAAEIEKRAADKRFVQVLLLAMDEMPLGNRRYWPIYAAAEKHQLPIGIHAGSAYRHPVSPAGWPTYYSEDYAAQSYGFQGALSSLICEGVFSKFPSLKVVLMESGVTWLPALLWRLTKFWHGLRSEVPWVDRPPTDIVRDSVRLTLQPFDAPDDPAQLARILDHLGSDEMLLFSTDYPHWQFDGETVLPEGISKELARKIMIDNPLSTYPRLRETVQ